MAWNPKIEETRLGVGARVQQERKGRAKRRWEIKPTTRLFARVRSVHVIYRHNTRLFRRLEATRHIHLTLELASLTRRDRTNARQEAWHTEYFRFPDLRVPTSGLLEYSSSAQVDSLG